MTRKFALVCQVPLAALQSRERHQQHRERSMPVLLTRRIEKPRALEALGDLRLLHSGMLRRTATSHRIWSPTRLIAARLSPRRKMSESLTKIIDRQVHSTAKNIRVVHS